MSIRWKLILGALSFLLLFGAVFVATSFVTASQKDDGLVLNLAGRQRALSQKMANELLTYADDPSDANWQSYLSTLTVFRSTLRAMTDGGEAPTTLDAAGPTAKLPAAADAKLHAGLEGIADLLSRFTRAASKVKDDAPAAHQAADVLVEKTPIVIAKMDAAVSRSQAVAGEEDLDIDARGEWNTIINYAGRQRLLLQRMTTLALAYLQEPSDEAKATLEQAMGVFETTHDALTVGGTVARDVDDDSDTEMIAAAPHPMVQARLEEAGGHWSKYRRSLKTLMGAAVTKDEALSGAASLAPTLLRDMNAVVERIQSLSEKKVSTIETVQIVALLFGLLFVIVAALMGNRIGSHIGEAVVAAETISDGDLTYRTEGAANDETGRLLESLNSMATDLSALVQQVQLSGVSVGASSGQIAAGSRRQEAAVSELAASATEIAATSTEIAATADELRQTMNAVGEVHEASARSAANSQRDLAEMERTMAHMVESTQAVSERLSVINEKTAKISSVVTTIMKIAQQTNLISLNAAIEAENAGELGLGFAVVAKEVRRLADQTAKASAGIEQMVGEMQSAVSTAVMGMDGFSLDIREGSEAVGGVVRRLGVLIEQVEQLGPRFESVREGMSAQAEGAGQIAEGVRQIVESSEDTAESVRETNVAITRLTQAAEQLQDGVAKFKVSENGVGAGR